MSAFRSLVWNATAAVAGPVPVLFTVLGTACTAVAATMASPIFDSSYGLAPVEKFVVGLFAVAPASMAATSYIAAWAWGSMSLAVAGIGPRPDDPSEQASRPGLARRAINMLRPSVGK